jgi:hypothetical protein
MFCAISSALALGGQLLSPWVVEHYQGITNDLVRKWTVGVLQANNANPAVFCSDFNDPRVDVTTSDNGGTMFALSRKFRSKIAQPLPAGGRRKEP